MIYKIYSYPKGFNTSYSYIDLMDNNYVDLVGISGITEYKRTLYSSSSSQGPGSTLTGSHVDPRSITLRLKAKNTVNSMESTIDYINKFLIQDPDYLELERNDSFRIKGKVESIMNPRFERDPVCEVDLLCDYPFFRSRNSYHAAFAHDQANHVFSTISDFIPASSNVPYGVIVEIKARGTIDSITFENVLYGESMSFGPFTTSSTSTYDTIVIDTRYKQESIINSTMESDLIGVFDLASDWVMMHPYRNHFKVSYTASNGDVSQVDLQYYPEKI